MKEWEIYPSAFGIQWHITAECDGNCKHCYVRDPKTYKKEIENELSLEELLKICDKIIQFKNKFHTDVSVILTGGHPLMRSEYKDIMKKLDKVNIPIRMLGNPSHLNSEIDFLKNSNLKEYQLSVDGNKEIHNQIRGKNYSFDGVMNAIDFLNSKNIPIGIMYTISKSNMNYLKNIFDKCVNKEVHRFSFDRVVPFGNAKEEELPNSEEYKKFIYDVYQHAISRDQQLVLKDQLYKPLLNEMGLFKPKKVDKIISGCLVGISGLSILSDGTVYPCRRLPIDIGKLPEQSIEEIFLESQEMKDLRDYESIEGCGECDLLPYCRGDRCVAYAVYGDYFAKDPQCWRCEK